MPVARRTTQETKHAIDIVRRTQYNLITNIHYINLTYVNFNSRVITLLLAVFFFLC